MYVMFRPLRLQNKRKKKERQLTEHECRVLRVCCNLRVHFLKRIFSAVTVLVSDIETGHVSAARDILLWLGWHEGGTGHP